MVTAAQLDLIIRAQDQASRTLNTVQRNLGGLDQATSRFGISSAVAYGAATAALGGFAAMGLNEVHEAERVTAQTNAVLESTGGVAGVTAGHVDHLADRLSNLAGVDDEVIASGANVMLTFTNIRNSGVDRHFDDANLAAANLSARLGSDLQANILLVGKALNDPLKGLSALTRAGVQFSVVQKQQVRDFMAVGDIASAQKIILGELETQFGGAAEAAGKTFGGQLDIAQIKLSNFSGEVMVHTIPALVALTGFSSDTITAIEKIGSVTEGARDSIFGFWEDLPGPLKDVALGLTVVTAVMASPVVAGFVGTTYAITRGIDALSGETDDAALSADAFADSLEGAQGAAGLATAAVSQLGTVIRTSTDLSNAGRGGEALAGVIGNVETAWDNAATAADDAKRAFFDALNTPSPERAVRTALLSQAELNLAKLTQQIEEGQGDRQAGPGWDGQTVKQVADWLANDLIPAEKEWLQIDSLQTDRNVTAAEAAEVLGLSYHDLAKIISGEAIPTLEDFTEGTYTAEDAINNATAALDGLAESSPAALAVTLDTPTPAAITRSAESIRSGFRGETPGSFGVGLTPDFQVPTAAERWRTGFRGETPANFGVGIVKDFEIPTTAERWRTGFRGETPATFGVGLKPDFTVPTAAERYRTGFRGETPATFGVGLKPDFTVPTAAERYRTGFRGETPATFGVGLKPDFTVPTAAERYRTGFRGETPATFGVGLKPDFTVPTAAERYRTGFRGETPATFGVGLKPDFTVPTAAERYRTGFRGETPAEFGVGLVADVPGAAATIRRDFRGEGPAAMDVVAASGSGYSVWDAIQDYMNSNSIGATVYAKVIYPRPDDRGAEPGSPVLPESTTGPISGGSVVNHVSMTNHFSGTFLGGPMQIAQFVRDLVMPEIRRQLERGG